MLKAAPLTQLPPLQNATDTIQTLSNRLLNATLLEDRRVAILGLKSFAREFPASVASGALRQLIGTLSKDVDDIDTGKLALETILNLFNPSSDSLETSETLALWLADEFTQRQDNIVLLLDQLDIDDFYTRLYALEILAAISSLRPSRTQECVLTAPLGTTRLVAVLDERREEIQTVGLLLLIELTAGSLELQKVVAFENAFDRIFNLISLDGGLAEGGRVVQDCLTLLANLLHLNASNQSLFRETGFIPKLGQLLVEVEHGHAADTDSQRMVEVEEKNVWGLLAVLRLFLIEGNPGCSVNQLAFEKHGLLRLLLNHAFSDDVGPHIKAEALRTCADMISSNSQVQQRFAHNLVRRHSGEQQLNGTNGVNGGSVTEVYVIDALLDAALSVPTVPMFDFRYAASQCIQAYFRNHTAIKLHFLRRAIEGHTAGGDEISNILTVLIQGPPSASAADPYRIWFAADILVQLLFENPEAKNSTMGVSEGDASSGEDLVTCIQSLTGHLVHSLRGIEDDRIPIAYLMVLCVWLFEDADAVNDLLSEASSIQSVLQFVSSAAPGRELVQGLCVFLLGILYEFSTKDSPISRRKLQPMIFSGLGREHYMAKLSSLREHTLIRDFEVMPQSLAGAEAGGLPEVYFDGLFVDFFKDNFSRLRRAVDTDPGKEVARIHEGIDRDLLDSLQTQIKDGQEAIQKAESDRLNLEGKLGQEQADHRRSQERFTAELARIKSINDALHAEHEADTQKMHSDNQSALHRQKEQHDRRVQDIEATMRRTREELLAQGRVVEDQNRAKTTLLQSRIGELDGETAKSKNTIEKLRQLNEALTRQIKDKEAEREILSGEKKLAEQNVDFQIQAADKLKELLKGLETRLKDSGKQLTELQVELNKKEEARAAVQVELDDLLILLGDLEEKRSRDKKQLKSLGEQVSDGDEDEDGDQDQDQDQDEDDEAEEEDGDERDEENETIPVEEESKEEESAETRVDGDSVIAEENDEDEGGYANGKVTPPAATNAKKNTPGGAGPMSALRSAVPEGDGEERHLSSRDGSEASID